MLATQDHTNIFHDVLKCVLLHSFSVWTDGDTRI